MSFCIKYDSIDPMYVFLSIYTKVIVKQLLYQKVIVIIRLYGYNGGGK